MKAIFVTGLLLNAQAIKFYDTYDDDMNEMVEQAASTSTYTINPNLSIALQRPDPESHIGKFSFSQALDFSNDKKLDELDGIMTKEYQNQFKKVDTHNN